MKWKHYKTSSRKDVQLKDVKETLSDKEATITSLQKQLSEAKIQQRQTSEENLDTAVTLSQKKLVKSY